MTNPQEEKPVKKIIAEYVERKDLYGLAEYFRAYIEDEMMEDKEKLVSKAEEMDWEKEFDELSDTRSETLKEVIEQIDRLPDQAIEEDPRDLVDRLEVIKILTTII